MEDDRQEQRRVSGNVRSVKFVERSKWKSVFHIYMSTWNEERLEWFIKWYDGSQGGETKA